ncbi:MAG: BatA domain-containing protein, partial [bacterium]
MNSLFLAGLAAMALPVVIHILNRRRLRKIRFSSLDFISELNKRRMSKINLRRWIILLLRTLAVGFVVLAFARPTFQGGNALFVPGEAPKHVVICMDVSYSMGAEQEKGTGFSAARDLAKDVIDECRRNDLVNVVAFSSRDNVLFETGTRNKAVVTTALDGLNVTEEGTAVGRAVETASRLISDSDMTLGEIYVISDFRDDGDTLRIPELPENTRLMLLPVYRESVDNVSIDHVFTPRKLIRPEETIRIGVAVSNHSLESPAEFPLELVIGGKRMAEKIVNLAPASSATETFVISLPDRGFYRCRVSKNRDRLAIDDERFFV